MNEFSFAFCIGYVITSITKSGLTTMRPHSRVVATLGPLNTFSNRVQQIQYNRSTERNVEI